MTEADSAARIGRGRWRKALLRLALSAAFLLVLFAFVPFGEVAAAMSRVAWPIWVAAIPTYLALHLIGVIKWRVLNNAAGAQLSFTVALRAYYAGLFGNTIMPSIIGGDVLRAAIAFNRVHSRTALIFGSALDRGLDFLGLLALAGLGALFAPQALDPRSRQVFLWVVLLLACAMAIGALAFWSILRLGGIRRLRRHLVRLRQALRSAAGAPAAVAGAFVLGLLLQSLLVLFNAWLGRQIGIEIPLYVWFFVWPLAKLAGIAPTQNGIGVREAAQVALFAPFGVGAAAAFGTGLVFEVIIIVGGLMAGILAWLLGLAYKAKTRSTALPQPPL
ncbi:MAG: lysylphosphatidylglycerol synthase transmembrane domain-containing protein [Steroidobacteraceae bacterium]